MPNDKARGAVRTEAIELRQGQVFIGPLFSEPMRVETVTANGAGSWIGWLGWPKL